MNLYKTKLILFATDKMISDGSMPEYPAPGFTSISTTHVDITSMVTPTTIRRRMLEQSVENESEGRLLSSSSYPGF